MDDYFILRPLKAKCKPASMLLGRYLIEEFDCRPIEFVSAQRWSESGGLARSHFWLEHQGVIVDITADQYPEIDQPVIVTTDRDWHDRFDHQSRYPYSDVVNDNTVQKFHTTYAYILSTLNNA